MNEEFKQLRGKEAIIAENDFLKMKMMLEKGAYFEYHNLIMSPEIENVFLKNILEIENEGEDFKKIRLFDKIDKPTIFRQVDEISDDQLGNALDSLLDWMSEYNIYIDVLNPAVSVRELYRFITEDLFDCQMDDVNLPGWSTRFIYDDFYPDAGCQN